jgi:hypothetical protein
METSGLNSENYFEVDGIKYDKTVPGTAAPRHMFTVLEDYITDDIGLSRINTNDAYYGVAGAARIHDLRYSEDYYGMRKTLSVHYTHFRSGERYQVRMHNGATGELYGQVIEAV